MYVQYPTLPIIFGLKNGGKYLLGNPRGWPFKIKKKECPEGPNTREQ
jgi:hypothetical protein